MHISVDNRKVVRVKRGSLVDELSMTSLLSLLFCMQLNPLLETHHFLPKDLVLQNVHSDSVIMKYTNRSDET